LVLDVLDQGVFTVDQDSCVTSFNRAAEEISGYGADEVIGQRCSDVFRTNLCAEVCPLRLSIASRRPLRNREVYIQAADGRTIPISVSTAPLVTRQGRLLGGVEVFRDLSQIVHLKRRLDGQYQLHDIIGRSQQMQQIFDLLPLLAEADSSVLVTGSSGTGKELVARTIHSLGARAKGPFVAVNCGAIPETLLESELFGYKRGAFTDARQDKPGRVAAAEGGTLFFDEVGDLPPLMQVKVLRFLQDRTYEPLGSTTSVRADVRVVAATNRELLSMVREGTFREDLYFRLNVIQVDIPPLAERPQDIPLLVTHFIRRFRQSTGKAIDSMEDDALGLLLGYEFPGNVRELENLIERAFILCQDSRISREQLPPALLALARPVRSSPDQPLTVSSYEVEAIKNALARHQNNRTRAAAELGIHRTTLIRKLRRLGL
jgi:PAS domain S-box-containing protein